jgi:hypothetical protein
MGGVQKWHYQNSPPVPDSLDSRNKFSTTLQM